MEASELCFYMLLVCTFTTLLQYPTSPVRHFIPSAVVRRAIMGLLVGLAVLAINMMPWGIRRRSEHLFDPDDCHPVCLESRSAGAIHTPRGGSPERHLHNLRNSPIRDEHEPSAKLQHDNDKRCIFLHGRWAARVQDPSF